MTKKLLFKCKVFKLFILLEIIKFNILFGWTISYLYYLSVDKTNLIDYFYFDNFKILLNF